MHISANAEGTGSAAAASVMRCLGLGRRGAAQPAAVLL